MSQSSITDIWRKTTLPALWDKYRLASAPHIYLVLTVVLLGVVIRNFRGGHPVLPVSCIMLFYLVTSISGLRFRRYFPLLSWISNLLIFPALSYLYLSWPGDYPPPTLIPLAFLSLLLVFADHIGTATVAFLFEISLIVFTVFNYPLGANDAEQLLVVTSLTATVIYASALGFWYTMTTLFQQHESLKRKLENSLETRQGILRDFFQETSQALEKLDLLLQSATPSWPAVLATTDKLNLAQARSRESAIGNQNLPAPPVAGPESGSARIQRNAWRLLVASAMTSSLVLTLYYLLVHDFLNLGAVFSASVCALVLWLDRFAQWRSIARICCIYILALQLTRSCLLQLPDDMHIYQLLYYTALVFCSALIFPLCHTLILASLGFAVAAAWYLQWPELSGPQVIVRSNMLYSLLFITLASIVLHFYLHRLLGDISRQEQRLRAETDRRYRLLATLFHDIANPLFALSASAEIHTHSLPGKARSPATMRRLLGTIRQLISTARDVEKLENEGRDLPLENVRLDQVLEDLEQIFRERLGEKQLTLKCAGCDETVLAHPLILGMSVLSNLLTNAIKFSPVGGTITISTEALDPNRLRISVQDEGSGLPHHIVAELQRGKYVQSTAGTCGESGSGHGLRLAMLYLEQMRGRLELDTGSTVSIVLQAGTR